MSQHYDERMKAALVLRSGNQKGRETQLQRGIYLLGRSKTCQIRPKSKQVSRRHCAIVNTGDAVFVKDIGSTTGTYINRQRIEVGEPVEMHDGDRLQVGTTRFRLAIEQAAGEAVAAVAEPKKPAAKAGKPASEASAANVDEEYSAKEVDLTRPVDSAEPAESGPNEKAQVEDAADHDPVADVLKMLEESDEEKGTREFVLAPSANAAAEVDLEEDSENDVEFTAPVSGESVSAEQELPSYAMRQDWDVASARQWAQKKAPVQKPIPKLGSQLKREQAALQKINPSVKVARSGPSIDNDTLQMVGMAVAFVVFVAWIAWNAWRLWSFQG